MREIVLDTETTGLDPAEGHRIVEIGALELVNHVPTGRTFHQYLDPMRPMPAEAFAIHGLGDDFLRGKPQFRTIMAELLLFIGDARLVIHNASFDMKFLNAELVAAGQSALPVQRAIDTVVLARQKFPGSPASLDALCRRFGIDNSSREKHGALLDSELLAEVYLELIGGRQPDLVMAPVSQPAGTIQLQSPEDWRPKARPTPLGSYLTTAEEEAHKAFVNSLGPHAIWSRRR
jgi:DNA polymerase-3 subunit epsilon